MNSATGLRIPLALIATLVAFAIAFGATASTAHAANAAEGASLAAGQVKAESATSLVAEKAAYSGLDVSTRVKLAGQNWRRAVAGGKVAGTTGTRAMRSLMVSLKNKGGLSGGIKYRIYARGAGWGKVTQNGRSTGSLGRDTEAVKIWLTGTVSKHYDVLYRAYTAGKGWQPWAKNGQTAGLANKGLYATAVQVKLTPKTLAAAGKRASATSIRYEASLTKTGWQPWKGNGRTAGKANQKYALDRFALQLSAGNLKGGVTYAAYSTGSKWRQGWVKNGRTAGVQSKQMQALRIKLTGNVASKYDIYYRTYVSGYKWLDWAKNGAVSGGPGNNLPVSAVQVRLVKKGASAPGRTTDTTVASKKKTLNGIDIASYQAGIDVANVDADFVIVKATGGTTYTNPYYKVHANAVLKSGKLLGLYHFACEYGKVNTPTAEADYFVNAAGPYIGKAVLVLDWEADALLLGPSWAKKFMDRVYKRTGVKPLIYMSQSKTYAYDWSKVAGKYKLWVAHYLYTGSGYRPNAPKDTVLGAWTKPTIFQYTSTGRISGYGSDLDLNVFYGKASAWKKLAAKS